MKTLSQLVLVPEEWPLFPAARTQLFVFPTLNDSGSIMIFDSQSCNSLPPYICSCVDEAVFPCRVPPPSLHRLLRHLPLQPNDCQHQRLQRRGSRANDIPRRPHEHLTVANDDAWQFTITSSDRLIMADKSLQTDGPAPSSEVGYDESLLPDYHTHFLSEAHLEAFAQALCAPDPSPSTEDLQAQLSFTQFRDASSTRRSSIDSSTTRSRSRPSSSILQRHGSAGASGSTPTSSPSMGQGSLFISAQSDWAPVGRPQSLLSGRGKKRASRRGSGAATPGSAAGKTKVKRQPRRSKDETREGYLYTLLQWPLLLLVGAWITGLGVTYGFTRLYIWTYEHFIAWRGHRAMLRGKLREAENYAIWMERARELDRYLGNERWMAEDRYAYYDSSTVKRVVGALARARGRVERDRESMGKRPSVSRRASKNGNGNGPPGRGETGAPLDKNVEDLRALVEACVKNNFVGVENTRLYSQTYSGTKNLVQKFVDESECGGGWTVVTDLANAILVEKCIDALAQTDQIGVDEKRAIFKRINANYGRTALCLSGGASFAYYHFGVIKALLDADLLPEVITGTSGGALIASLVATRTNDELKQLLVPALAGKINACSEPFTTWFPRWWKTGARFDSVDWAKRCSWFTRGSMTFREAYERTGRILNVSCVPADPHSPTILTNYLTSPDCVIWSAVLASAAVPGILNPVVLMMKNPDGSLSPYSFGHKWKDGSLRTDIPLKALNIHFNVNFSIVSQVNPHINLFFYSSRGTVGQPVTHRRGRGWRGGFLGSAAEQYLKLDLNKWLKVMRHLELLPRPLGQDWSQVWLQQFSGTITTWPKSTFSDFWRILSDPNPRQLARMLHVGQQSAFPKLQFLGNRMKVERAIARGRRAVRLVAERSGHASFLTDDEDEQMRSLPDTATATEDDATSDETDAVMTGDDFEDAVNVLAPLLGEDKE